jgi:formylglycine-generating enzyme
LALAAARCCDTLEDAMKKTSVPIAGVTIMFLACEAFSPTAKPDALDGGDFASDASAFLRTDGALQDAPYTDSAAQDASNADDAALDAATQDSSVRDASVDARDAAGLTCPLGMIRILSAYCIDPVEVSESKYGDFLKAVAAGSVTNSDSRCSWNTDYKNVAFRSLSEKPVTNVDFCDATTYCTYVGKRLCGKRSGVGDEWWTACTTNGKSNFPYAMTFKDNVCLVHGPQTTPLRDTKPSVCEGGYAGLYEMVGNVNEWTDVLDDGAGALGKARFQGGGLAQPDSYGCGANLDAPRSDFGGDIGFRCCADLR